MGKQLTPQQTSYDANKLLELASQLYGKPGEQRPFNPVKSVTELPPDTTEGIVTSKKEVKPEYPKLFNPAKKILSRDYSNPYLKKLPSDVQQYMADNQIDLDNPTPTKDVFLAPEQVVKADGGDVLAIYKNRVAKGEIQNQGVVGETQKANAERAQLAFDAVDAIMKGDVPVTPLYFVKQWGKGVIAGAENLGEGLSTLSGISKGNVNPKEFTTGALKTLEGGISTAFNVAPGSREFMMAIGNIAPIAALGGEVLSKATGMDEATSQEMASLVMNIPFGKQMVIGALASSGLSSLSDKLTQGLPLSDEEKGMINNVAGTIGFVGGAHLSGSRTGTKILADLKSVATEPLETRSANPNLNLFVKQKAEVTPETELNKPDSKITDEGMKYFKERLNDPATTPNEKAFIVDLFKKYNIDMKDINIPETPKEVKELLQTPFEKVTQKPKSEANVKSEGASELSTEKPIVEKTQTPSQIATDPTKDRAPAVPPIESGKSEGNFGGVPDIGEIVNDAKLLNTINDQAEAVSTKGAKVFLTRDEVSEGHPDLKKGTIGTVIKPTNPLDQGMVVIEYKDSAGKGKTVAVRPYSLLPNKLSMVLPDIPEEFKPQVKNPVQSEPDLVKKEPLEMSRDEFNRGDKKLLDFVPAGTVKEVSLINKNVTQGASEGSGKAFITKEGLINLDNNFYTVGDNAYLHDGKFYKKPPKGLVDKIENNIKSHLEMLIEESEKIDRNAIVPEKEQDAWYNDSEGTKEKTKYLDTSVRYRNLDKGYGGNNYGDKIDRISKTHNPEALHNYLFNEELQKYRFEIGGYLHVRDQKPLT